MNKIEFLKEKRGNGRWLDFEYLKFFKMINDVDLSERDIFFCL